MQDHHIAEAADQEQRYLADGWHERFGRGPDPQDHGHGHTPAEVASVFGVSSPADVRSPVRWSILDGWVTMPI